MDKTYSKHRCFLICLALAFTTIAAYWQVHNYDFGGYDDYSYVVDNPHVKAGLTRDSVIWAFTQYLSYWHPLSWLSHMLDCQLFGVNPSRHHLTNLLLHIANALLLFTLLKRMTGALWRSAFVAALFALHPLNVESVAWITERKGLLSTLFWMLTIGAYVRYVRCPSASRYLLTLLTFALGLMAKPVLVTLPFVLLLLDYWPLGRFQCDKLNGHSNTKTYKSILSGYQSSLTFHLVKEKIPLFALSVASVYLSSLSVQRLGIVISTETAPMKLRIANALVSYVTYITNVFWPNNLAIFYPYPTVVPLWQAAVTALLLVGISSLVILLARRHRYLLVGWFWYLGTLVPVIGLMQAGTWPARADRYAYIPLIGLFIVVAWGAPDLLAKWRHQRIALRIPALVVILVVSVCTHFQLRHWRDGVTLYERVIDVWPDRVAMSAKTEVHRKLALRLSMLGKFDQALLHHKEVLSIDPRNGKSLNSLAWILATAADAKLRSPEDAVFYAHKACMLTDFQDALLLDTLAAAYAAAGRFSEAVATAEEAVKLATDDESKQEFQERLNLYKAGKPYIQPAREPASN